MVSIFCFRPLKIKCVNLTQTNEQTKQNKTVVKVHYLLGGETANHVNFMQHS